MARAIRDLSQIKRIVVFNFVSVAIVILAWEILSRLVHSHYFPGPTDVARALVSLSVSGDIEGIKLLDHAATSIFRILTGFGVAALTAVPTGIVMGLRREIYESSKAVLEPLRFVPPIAWIPLAILLLSGYSRYIFLIWLGAFFPILLNTIAGFQRISRVLVDVARVFGGNRRAIIWKIAIPSALPEIMTGFRVGLGVGWMCIVAAEMIGGEVRGLGWLILKNGVLLNVSGMIAGMIAVGVIGLVMNEGLLRAEKSLFKWRVEVRV